jgi:DNA-directed RNA polymerase subunit B'
MADVYFNGKFVGTCSDPETFIGNIRTNRRKGKYSDDLNVTYHPEEDNVIISTEKGRARRPLIVVEKGKPILTDEHLKKLEDGEIKFGDLVAKGIIEYLDAEEEENSLIAISPEQVRPEHTHLELSPIVILGSQAAMVPYPEHNVAPRVMIGAKTIKQGIGLYASNYLMRSDTDVSILHYPQKPVVTTKMYDVVNFGTHPVGQNVIIAIMAWEGYNMDDAVIVNGSSIQRGLFRSTYYRPYSIEELRYPGGQVDSIEVPDKEVRGYRTEDVYRFLEKDGIIYPEAEVSSGEVLIGKTSPPRFLSSLEEFRFGVEARRETSEVVRHRESGVVESVILTESEDGNKYVKVKVRDERIPEIGDKFASRHGQKGVIGLTVPQEDMPFTANGVVPDIIFSPHSIPSRMTVGQLLEILGGKVGALMGTPIDGSPFGGQKENELRSLLKDLGFRDNGTETMYNGKTGQIYKARIMIGNVYYLKLRHMVANKLHARSRGPVQLLTRQPTEGRSKEGGLRLGEMENHCFVAHGAALTLKERFDSDKAIIPICKRCGLVAIYNRFRRKGVCSACGDDVPIAFIEMSYAFKLLLDELKSLCIYPKILVEPK